MDSDSHVWIIILVVAACTALLLFLWKKYGMRPKDTEMTEDEIISIVNEGQEQGVLDAQEAEMIQNIFELDDKRAADIMTHRKNIIGIKGDTNLRDAIAFMAEQTVSRFPVYEESIDDIKGILHFRDAMRFHILHQYDDWRIIDIPDLLNPVRFIPETRDISRLFKTMQSEKIQMVLVADEYGETSGLVTMEDILEEIVGNIQDEYDDEVERIQKNENGDYIMDGMTQLEEVGAALHIAFEDEEFDTLNGFLISKLDRIPTADENEEIRAYGYLFRILSVEGNIIQSVRVTKLEEHSEEETSNEANE